MKTILTITLSLLLTFAYSQGMLVRKVSSSGGGGFSNETYVHFDGTDSYLSNDPSSPTTQTVSGEFTLSFWFRNDNVTTTNTMYLFNRGFNTYIKFLSSYLTFIINLTTYTFTFDTPASLGNNNWYHMAFVRDASNNITLYINGVDQDDVETSSSNVLFHQIGTFNSNFDTYDLDEFVIYGSDQSANISTLFGGVTGDPTGAGDPTSIATPLYYYSMGDEEGFTYPTVTNEGSAGYNYTLYYGAAEDFISH